MRYIPVIVNDEYFDLFVILQDKSIARMKAYDPPEIVLSSLPDEYRSRRVNNIILMYASDQDFKAVTAACEAGEEVRVALRILSRGFQWRPGSREVERD